MKKLILVIGIGAAIVGACSVVKAADNLRVGNGAPALLRSCFRLRLVTQPTTS